MQVSSFKTEMSGFQNNQINTKGQEMKSNDWQKDKGEEQKSKECEVYELAV